MAEVVNTSWYRRGTISLATNSTKVTGTNTSWKTAGINPGATFRVDRQPYAYEVAEVVSDTELRLATPYYENGGAGLSYSIDRNFQSTPLAKMAADIASLVSIYELVQNNEILKLQGKDAYEVAVAAGYTGTREQWLESLKAAGELAALNSKIEVLTSHNSGAHNALCLDKNLGTSLTEAQSAAIRSGSFEGIYPGCYWQITTTYTYYAETSDTAAQNGKTYYADVNGTALIVPLEEGADISEAGYYEAVTDTVTVNWRVVALDYYWLTAPSAVASHHVVVVPDKGLYWARMNPTNTTEGGYLGSEMHTKGLVRARRLIAAAFGENHILKHSNFLVNATENGKPVGGAWAECFAELMNEQVLFGGKCHAVANSGENLSQLEFAAIDKSQYPFFAYRPDLISNRDWIWLRDNSDASRFAFVNNQGLAAQYWASHSNPGCGVRPYFLVY